MPLPKPRLPKPEEMPKLLSRVYDKGKRGVKLIFTKEGRERFREYWKQRKMKK